MRKFILIGIFVVAGILGIWAYKTSNSVSVLPLISNNASIVERKIVNPFGSLLKDVKESVVPPKSALEDKEVLNILLIGIDRRNKSQMGFNTDTMILVSAKPSTNKVLLTSIPRDLWINGEKINALYTVNGPDSLVDAFEQVTDLKVDGYVTADFADFKWLVDSLGGVPVEVERTFTDNSFPDDLDTMTLTVTFNQGLETMNGDRALTFARSRKGTNGEGSDLMRAKRQHLILKSLGEAVKQPTSMFWPFDIKQFYQAATAVGKMRTTLSLDDCAYLWDFYKDKEQYQIESFVIDDTYIYHPGTYPNSAYHAWVYVPKDTTWDQLHLDIQAKLTPVL